MKEEIEERIYADKRKTDNNKDSIKNLLKEKKILLVLKKDEINNTREEIN